MIKLQNLQSSPKTYEIPISAGFGSVHQTVHTIKYSLGTADSATGGAPLKSERREIRRQFPHSITLMSKNTKGDTSGPLEDGIQRVEPFRTAIQKGLLKVIPVVVEKVEEEPPADTTSGSPSPNETTSPSPSPSENITAPSAPDGPGTAEITSDAPTARTNKQRGGK